MKKLISDFGLRIDEKFKRLAPKLLLNHPDYKFITGINSNESYPLRAFISIFKNSQSEELAISIDIKKQNSFFLLEGDVCLQDGTIIAEVPSIQFSGEDTQTKIEIQLEQWLSDFDKTIIENSKNIAAAIEAIEELDD